MTIPDQQPPSEQAKPHDEFVPPYGDGVTYADVLSRAAEALYDAEIGPYAAAIGESWETQKQEVWEAIADAVLRSIGVPCLFKVQLCPDCSEALTAWVAEGGR